MILGFRVIGSTPVRAGDNGDKTSPSDRAVTAHARAMIEEGRQTFRFDTFGDEHFWGDALRIHESIAGAALGGVGPGLGAGTALGAGLKVDVDALPRPLLEQLKAGTVDLGSPRTTIALLKLHAVVDHYDAFFTLGLSAREKSDLVQYLESL
jgi:hypothetical protein